MLHSFSFFPFSIVLSLANMLTFWKVM
uniref:Uncharacterized protein n=1 Tax=Anopheles minimus TaxID=112268 RepID=A0A182WPI4_9DIPT